MSLPLNEGKYKEAGDLASFPAALPAPNGAAPPVRRGTMIVSAHAGCVRAGCGAEKGSEGRDEGRFCGENIQSQYEVKMEI